jgi:hypothetical protein
LAPQFRLLLLLTLDDDEYEVSPTLDLLAPRDDRRLVKRARVSVNDDDDDNKQLFDRSTPIVQPANL